MTQSGKPAVLFLCTRNSCRSQIAAGLLRHYGGHRYEAHSAGTEPAGIVHPLAIQVMEELGIDISGQQPKDVGVYLGRLSVRHLFIVCEEAEKRCPRIFPGTLGRSIWPLDDPAAFAGTHEVKAEKFRAIRDELHERIEHWITEQE